MPETGTLIQANIIDTAAERSGQDAKGRISQAEV